MRLSEAILMGRTLVKQQAYELDGCALGMAIKSCGLRTEFSELEVRWPWLGDRVGQMPCKCGLEPHTDYMIAVAHLFDRHVMREAYPYRPEEDASWLKPWTLEQLIDWVRSVEPAEPEPAETNELQQALEGEYARQS